LSFFLKDKWIILKEKSAVRPGKPAGLAGKPLKIAGLAVYPAKNGNCPDQWDIDAPRFLSRCMPPRRGWGIFGLGFYKDGAPTVLRIYFPDAWGSGRLSA